ncbi:MAG: hypothetical protein EB124_11155 [Betaproteobacteria bacterium]|nr:hypothetical protein [Betaproteobacteria bacterium]
MQRPLTSTQGRRRSRGAIRLVRRRYAGAKMPDWMDYFGHDRSRSALIRTAYSVLLAACCAPYVSYECRFSQ